MLCLLMLAAVPLTCCQTLILYSIEADFPSSQGAERFPIIEEPMDSGSFKVGSLGLSLTPNYVSLVVGASGRLLDMNGMSVGFNGDSNLGANPADPEDHGFFVQDGLLWYEDGTDWTLCPFKRGNADIYTIQYNSTCSGGYSTKLWIVKRQLYFSTVLPRLNCTALQTDYTSYTDNSLHSYTVLLPQQGRPRTLFAMLLWRLVFVLAV